MRTITEMQNEIINEYGLESIYTINFFSACESENIEVIEELFFDLIGG